MTVTVKSTHWPVGFLEGDGPGWGEVLVADSYDLTSDDLAVLRRKTGKLAVIDDLADRHLPADLVVNGGVGAGLLKYRGLPDTRYLLGPAYALLREEFAKVQERPRDQEVDRVVITTGGSDPHHLTPRFIEWAERALGRVTMDVVVGPFFDRPEDVEGAAACARSRVILHRNPRDLWRLMAEADLALCGGGQTLYELAACGTPSVVVRMGENQRGNIDGFLCAGTLMSAGGACSPDLREAACNGLIALATNPVGRSQMGARGRKLVDGLGAMRVAEALAALVAEACSAS